MKMKPYKIKSEIVFLPNRNSTGIDMKIFYECDGLACKACNDENCYLTSDIEHAKRFDFLD